MEVRESVASLSKDPALLLSFTEKCPSSSLNMYPFLSPFLQSILYLHVHVCACARVCGKKGYKANAFFQGLTLLLCYAFDRVCMVNKCIKI